MGEAPPWEKGDPINVLIAVPEHDEILVMLGGKVVEARPPIVAVAVPNVKPQRPLDDEMAVLLFQAKDFFNEDFGPPEVFLHDTLGYAGD